jgi:enediyne biosynthesis protein E4
VTIGVTSADVNRDGLRDLLITTSTLKNVKLKIPRAENLLFLNKGNLKFEDATKDFGLHKFKSFSTGASFGDVNKDGYPDLYIGNYFQDYDGPLDEINDATIVNASSVAEDYLLINHDGKKFKNEYKEYGLNHKGFGFGGLFTDYDNDGDLDIMVINDFGYKAKPNYLLKNQWPEKKFSYAEKETGLDLRINAMTAAAGDYNNDGWMDYFITNIKFNRFMVRNQHGFYEDKCRELGTSFYTVSWGANFADFDSDGDLDLFVANGDLNPYCQPMGSFLWENKGGKFEDVAFVAGIQDYGISRGTVVFDYDNDGDEDVLVVNQKPVKPNYPVPSFTRLYRNDTPNKNWIKVQLNGINFDKNGLGARVKLYTDSLVMMREVDGGMSSHLSQNSVVQHFGIGGQNIVDSIVVDWIGGHKETFKNIPINQLYQLTEISNFSNKSQGNLLTKFALFVLISISLILIFIKFFR